MGWCLCCSGTEAALWSACTAKASARETPTVSRGSVLGPQRRGHPQAVAHRSGPFARLFAVAAFVGALWWRLVGRACRWWWRAQWKDQTQASLPSRCLRRRMEPSGIIKPQRAHQCVQRPSSAITSAQQLGPRQLSTPNQGMEHPAAMAMVAEQRGSLGSAGMLGLEGTVVLPVPARTTHQPALHNLPSTIRIIYIMELAWIAIWRICWVFGRVSRSGCD